MANYQLKNLKTGNVLMQYTQGTGISNLFEAAVEQAKAFAQSLGQPIAVMGQPFFDETDRGTEFTSQLYVAQP